MDREFRIQKHKVKSDIKKLQSLEREFGAGLGDIKIKITLSGSEVVFKYQTITDYGKFVNFGGLLFNTESGYIALGFNANNNYYIPIISIVDIFNGILVDDGVKKPEYSLDDILVFIERYKMDYSSVKVVDYFKNLNNAPVSTYNRKSVTLNFVDSKVDKGTPNTKVFKRVDYMEDFNFYSVFLKAMSSIDSWVKELSKEFFGNYILEDSYKATNNVNNRSMTTKLYLESIKNGADAIFMKELSSFGFSIKRRAQAYSLSISSKMEKADYYCALLSSGAYADAYNDDKFERIPEDKMKTYNLVDLLRSIDKDQDMFFSLDEMKDSPNKTGNPAYMQALLKKLNLETVFAGIKEAGKFIESYSKLMGLNDSGSSYTMSIKSKQKDLIPVSVRSLPNAGKMVNKLSARILKKF